MNRIIALVVVVVAVLFAGSSMIYVVDQQQMAVVSSHGGDNPLVEGPGLHFKLPPPLQTAAFVDTRIQTLDAPDADRYATSDKIDLLVNPVLKFRVSDPLKLFVETKGDPQSVSEQLVTQLRGALGDAFAKYALADAIGKQQAIADEAREAMQKQASSFGIEIVDIELTRIDFPAAMADTVYKRMIAAREQAADQERAQGAAEAEQIKADAERKQQAVLADAYKQAQSIKGEGDGKAAVIAADAFSRDPQFYQFYQSLQAYRSIFKPNDVIVVDPDSDFFRFMRSPEGSAPAPETASRKH
jgi:modulator of FtsH protease HflC